MTELDPLSEAMVRLFLRIDAAQPTDPVLRAAAEFWQDRRGGKVMPDRDDLTELPAILLPHVFHAHLAINGSQHWLISLAGSFARELLGITGHEPAEAADKRMAVRLRHLFDLVAARAEPYSAMFEMADGDGRRHLVEIYAAPVQRPEQSEHLIFATANSRREA
ncbi:MAG: PAS domain-containing protein [Alphaproteobacteria bacterium]|nr:PAS domain-containing protein [Alphaproteobacteria bacterium]